MKTICCLEAVIVKKSNKKHIFKIREKYSLKQFWHNLCFTLPLELLELKKNQKKKRVIINFNKLVS